MITQITKKVALCEQSDITEKSLTKGNFDGILNVNDREYKSETQLCDKLGIYYKFCPIPPDNTKNMETFRQSIQNAAYELTTMTPVFYKILVHCLGSIDRAPLVVALSITDLAYLTLPQAYSIVKQQRRHIVEHYEWV